MRDPSDLTTWTDNELLEQMKMLTDTVRVSLLPDADSDMRGTAAMVMGHLADISRLLGERVPQIKQQIKEIIADVAGPHQAFVKEMEEADSLARRTIRSVFLRDEDTKHMGGWVFVESRDYTVLLPAEGTPDYVNLLAYLQANAPQVIKTTVKLREFQAFAKGKHQRSILKEFGVLLERTSHVALEPRTPPIE